MVYGVRLKRSLFNGLLIIKTFFLSHANNIDQLFFQRTMIKKDIIRGGFIHEQQEQDDLRRKREANISKDKIEKFKKSFLENKALPLVVCLAKGKTWTDEEFNGELVAWDVKFYPAEVEVLRPMIEGDGLIQLMQKRVPVERIEALHAKLDNNPA